MLLEYEGKHLLESAGIAIPDHKVAQTVDEVERFATELGGPVAVKAQVPAGGRGKAGGVVIAATVSEAIRAANDMLGSMLGEHRVDAVLVEQAVDIAEEWYLAATIDPATGEPILMESDRGGVEVEALTDDMRITRFDPADRPSPDANPQSTKPQSTKPRSADLESSEAQRAAITNAVIDVFVHYEALLVEINPLVLTRSGHVVALDAKVELDESANHRRPDGEHWPNRSAGTEREKAAAELGLRLIELGGDVAILANGAGLTMATVDAVAHCGGRPANFLEIGGDAYTKAIPALELVLSLPGIRSLVVNFCGAFARCDVMTSGVIEAWKALTPSIPIHFAISGTGADEARQQVRNELGLEPYPTMEDAVRAAVNADDETANDARSKQ